LYDQCQQANPCEDHSENFALIAVHDVHSFHIVESVVFLLSIRSISDTKVKHTFQKYKYTLLLLKQALH
jgi:hypothetical protein